MSKGRNREKKMQIKGKRIRREKEEEEKRREEAEKI